MLKLFDRILGRQASRHARFLEVYASLLEAGLLPAAALEQEGCASLAPEGRLAAIAALRRGGRLAAAFAEMGFPRATVARIEAAESAGRAPAAMRALAAEATRNVELARAAAGRALYPLFIIHAAPVAAAVPALVRGEVGDAVRTITLVLVPIDLALAAAVVFLRSAWTGGAWAAPASRLPWLGASLRDRALAPFLRALADLHESGAPFDRAVESAASAAPEPFASRYRSAAGVVRAGSPLVPALAGGGGVDATTLAVLGPAEQTGTLGQALPRSADVAEERLSHALRLGSRGPGAVLYAVAVTLVFWAAYKVVLAPVLGVLEQH